MTPLVKKTLFWTPRVLCILFALFLMMFSLDVLAGNPNLKDAVIGLIMHNIPVFALLIVLWFAWRWEWVGAVIFPAVGVFYIVWGWGRIHISAFFLISGPLFVVGLLFLLNWIYRNKIRIET
ncbi:MAG: hypothetical protein FJY65_02600 [Calditrichaeota bacterium]|nr:hypothetical protein [Calditrichota bacterium]